jgi:26S proteasome non-ATPase regulatory subunit 9
MKKIEEGLHKIHALAGASEVQESVSNVLENQETETLEPFLRVNLVSPGSPAEIAVCYFIFALLSIDSLESLAFN